MNNNTAYLAKQPDTTISNPPPTTINSVAGLLTQNQITEITEAAVKAVNDSTAAPAPASAPAPAVAPTPESEATEQAVKDTHAAVNNAGDDNATREAAKSALEAAQAKLAELKATQQGGRRRTKHKKGKSSKKVAKRRKSRKTKSSSKKSRRSSGKKSRRHGRK